MKDEIKEGNIQVEVKRNGPLIITGKLEINSTNKSENADRIVICRCGASGKMPFCDATHNRINFQAD